MSPLAASVMDVLGTILGVLLALTGLALAFMGLAAAVEGTPRRGLVGLIVGAALFVAGLWLVGFV